jgi:hypothetical protein
MEYLGHIRFSTHAVSISRDCEDRLHCFKYNRRKCDLDIFDDLEAAGDWIIEPLSSITWYIDFGEGDSE